MSADPSDTAARLAQVRRRIGKAAAAGRSPEDITLTAVTKQQPWDEIALAIAAGQRVFGENRVQEAQARWGGKRDEIEGLELRLIGPLQSNKAAEALALFDVIETLDREKLARVLAAEIAVGAPRPRLYIQVNTGEEPQKAGVSPRDADAFIAFCHADCGLEIEGLMCIPPADEEPAMHFALLGKIAARNGLLKLSMGMSGDYETAVRLGATSVRVGSAIFGERG
jgi:pyridoxal phosphate enzyme (YggS family)